MGSNLIPVGIVEDHPFFRAGLRQAVDASRDMTVTCAASALEELAPSAFASTAVLMLDLQLPGLRGTAAVRYARQHGPAVLVLSAFAEPADVVQAVRAGAAGYLSKHVEEQELLRAIRTVASGRTYVTPTLASYLLETPISLTQREREILERVADGDTDQDIADGLGISVHTVHSHLDRIRDKTGSHRRTELARLVTGHRNHPRPHREG